MGKFTPGDSKIPDVSTSSPTTIYIPPERSFTCKTLKTVTDVIAKAADTTDTPHVGYHLNAADKGPHPSSTNRTSK
ncbi:unnamed protein product [Fusarium fujikuroi]|nr:unnamed protein product [Fusarium fujikuroi]